jgi:hypothetical protein
METRHEPGGDVKPACSGACSTTSSAAQRFASMLPFQCVDVGGRSDSRE